ncbi:MAG: hypothetical protein IPH57_18855 [Saprospiraceae bacterium]|nr:hypothetical protein [Saprospiraceae bacterium]
MSSFSKYEPGIEEIAVIAKAIQASCERYILKKLSKMNTCCYSGNLVDELPISRSTFLSI